MILPVGRAEPALAEQSAAARPRSSGSRARGGALAGRAVQLDQRHLDLAGGRRRGLARRAHRLVDRVDRPLRDRQQPVVAEGAMPRDRGLDQMTDAVQLVAPGEVAGRVVRRRRPGRRCSGSRRDAAPPRSARWPRRPSGARAGSGRAAELPRRGLEPLVHVRVEEREHRACCRTPAPGSFPGRRPRGGSSRASRQARAGRSRGERALAIVPQPIAPEAAIQADIPGADRGQPSMADAVGWTPVTGARTSVDISRRPGSWLDVPPITIAPANTHAGIRLRPNGCENRPSSGAACLRRANHLTAPLSRPET